MAEPIVLISSIVEVLLVKLQYSLDEKNVLFQQGVAYDDLDKLKTSLSSIRGFLFDAENQQSHNDRVRRWLEELKDACCDAQNALEDLEKVLRWKSKVDRSWSITGKVCDFISFSKPPDLSFDENNNKIKEIGEKLDGIQARMSEFHFKDRNVVWDREMTTPSFVDDFDRVFESELVKESIVRTLPQSHDVEFGVCAIVGGSGVGKTKLAKMVYDDQRVESYFDIRMWACFPYKFAEKKILIDMIYSLTGHVESNIEVDLLREILHDLLKGKKYLLVLDDVLTIDEKQWNEFIRLLSIGAKESRIIVITTSNEVASMVGTWRKLSVRCLSNKSILSLFMIHAFENGKEKDPNLRTIGEEIAGKCLGHPLVAKILASTLYFSSDGDDWKYVKDNIVVDKDGKLDTPSALKLSYNRLPPCLKQCFVYCSIFPKEYEFNNIILIQFWMANGLLQRDKRDNEEEVIGMQYINELRRRCFFHDFEQKFDFIYFKMHHLVHDLAREIAKEWGGSLKLNGDREEKELACTCLKLKEDREKKEQGCNELMRRSILFYGMTPSQSVIRSCIFNAPNLRALDLRSSDIEVLPQSIGNLTDLRYLNLTKSVKIRRLPQSLCTLTRLETLLLGGCKGLKVLPTDISHLGKLRMLVFSSKQKELPENGIGHLTSLRCLGIGSCYNLQHLFKDISGLKHLQTLVIGNCPNLVSLPPGVKNLSSLKELMIYSRQKHGYSQLKMDIDCSSSDQSSEPPHLQMLCIDGLPEFQALPQWLLKSSANTLKWLAIRNCPNFERLTALNCPNIERLTAEPPQVLKSLEVLEFSSCQKLSSPVEDMGSLTALRELKIQDCPNLSSKCKHRGEDWSKISRINKIEIDGKLQGRDAFTSGINGRSDYLIWAGFDVAGYARFKTAKQIGSP